MYYTLEGMTAVGLDSPQGYFYCMNSGIYSITNKIDGKLYIGYTTAFNSGWKSSRLYKLKNGKHGNKYLQGAFNICGINNFKFERIEICEESMLYEREHYWCMLLKAHDRGYGYNIKPTGKDAHVGHAEESKEIIKEKRKLQITTPEQRAKQSKSLTGYKRSREEIEKSLKTKAEKGYYFSPERRRKMSEAKKKYLSIPENRKKQDYRSTAVIQMDRNGIPIKEWESAKSAGLALGVSASAIGAVCHNKKYNNTAGGYKWKFK